MTWKKAAVSQEVHGYPEPVRNIVSIGFFYPSDGKTVGLRGELLDEAGRPLGRLEVLLSYDYLMQETSQGRLAGSPNGLPGER